MPTQRLKVYDALNAYNKQIRLSVINKRKKIFISPVRPQAGSLSGNGLQKADADGDAGDKPERS